MSKRRRLVIREITRFPNEDPGDNLVFDEGVNVIVGVPNTGKSKWLRMIDFVLGYDKSPAEAFSEELAAKYHSIHAVLSAGDNEMVVFRQWDDPKLATKIQVDGEWMTIHSFTLRLLEALEIPVLHYPQGNPYGTRTWPELGWRSLIRHVYRRQLRWSDLADDQPQSEQHACLLQFVGIAEHLFSKEYGELVTSEKQIQKLQNDRERFIETLQEVSRDLINEQELGVAMTPVSIANAISRHQGEINELEGQKRQALAAALRPVAGEGRVHVSNITNERLGGELAAARGRQTENFTSLRKARDRYQEMTSYKEAIEGELGRLARASEAGILLADLKITNCPACDRPISKPEEVIDHCYLCKRPNAAKTDESADERLKFEVQQLQGELNEAKELIRRIGDDMATLGKNEMALRSEVANLEGKLRPMAEAVTALLPPELGVYDQEIGRIRERIAQLDRVAATLSRREAIAQEIDRIQLEVAELERQVGEQIKLISFERASDDLTDGMNTYLNELNKRKSGARPWTQGEVDFRLSERAFNVRIGKSDWSAKLGGTLTLYFLIAYHYGLLLLSPKPKAHFPALCILDFPPELDGVSVSDSENFVLEPFVKMLSNGIEGQVIAAGSSFAGLEGAKRLSLSRVWG